MYFLFKGNFVCSSTKETEELAHKFAEELKSPCVVAFYGDLGVGKTFFIQAMCRYWGVSDCVSSPTFSLLCEYEGSDFPIFHFDAYRLDSESFVDAGFDEYLFSDGVCLIEWAENISLDKGCFKVYIKGSGDGVRDITITYDD